MLSLKKGTPSTLLSRLGKALLQTCSLVLSISMSLPQEGFQTQHVDGCFIAYNPRHYILIDMYNVYEYVIKTSVGLVSH